MKSFVNNIVVVDDSKFNILSISDLLKKNNYNVMSFLKAEDALQYISISYSKIDLILLDVVMPIIDGYSLCKIIKSNKSTSNIPVMFLTSKTGTEDLIKGFELGAVDYIKKPFNEFELINRVKAHITIREFQKELEEKNKLLQDEIMVRKETERMLQKLATIDTLTEIHNRRYFLESANEFFGKSIANDEKMSMMILDIDYFKKVNDTHGHPIGDQVLTEIGRVLKFESDENIVTGRIGGEEFAIAVYGDDIIEAEKKAQTIRRKIKNITISSEVSLVKVTASIGVVEKSNNISSLKQMLVYADNALYLAKNTGRDKVVTQYIV